MEKLIILDYSTSSVDIYDILENSEIDDDYLKSLGFRPKDCSWMISSSPLITYHKEVLK